MCFLTWDINFMCFLNRDINFMCFLTWDINFMKYTVHLWPVPVAAWSKVYACCRSPAEIVGSNPAGGMDVCRECCVFSGRGLCD
jgi:hypothetical protein